MLRPRTPRPSATPLASEGGYRCSDRKFLISTAKALLWQRGAAKGRGVLS